MFESLIIAAALCGQSYPVEACVRQNQIVYELGELPNRSSYEEWVAYGDSWKKIIVVDGCVPEVKNVCRNGTNVVIYEYRAYTPVNKVLTYDFWLAKQRQAQQRVQALPQPQHIQFPVNPEVPQNDLRIRPSQLIEPSRRMVPNYKLSED